ncbi:hypothetical protein [Actinomadura chokoriensis]|uniref:hypothetical protein n=1 Tax=Actinomadura chokoriensis TaxID=454156 RepID=UPI0031F8B8F1
MDPDGARRSLDTMRRMQDRTREEYLRQSFARPGVLLIGLGLFIVCASFDLPGWWDTVAMAVGDALILAVIAFGCARASVHRKPSGAELVFMLAASAYLIAGFVTLQVVARLVEFPAPYTIAAAVTALTFVALTRPMRRVYATILR